MKYLIKFESFHTSMSKEEMIQQLCNYGWEREELEMMEEMELQNMCSELPAEIAEGKKWIQKAIKRKGALRSKMGKEEGEKISASEISAELSKLKKKDKDLDKDGLQLSKTDRIKHKQLILAKTLKGMK